MQEMELPTGQKVIFTGSDEDAVKYKAILESRHNFSMKYAKDRGWMKDGDTFKSLSIKQVLEIREQEEWKNP